MSKYFSTLFLSLLLSQRLLSMPCDSTYSCKTTSGKYRIEVQRCRYDNAIRGLVGLKVSGQDLAQTAKLGPSWEGDDYLAFQIDLPDKDSASRLLSVEVVKKTGNGKLTEKVRKETPGPWKSTTSESISCKETD